MAYIPPLNGGRLNASIGGNSTSAGAGYALLSTGTLMLAGGNNVTLSQNGGSITISAGNAGGNVNFSAGTVSNTLTAVTFADSNGVSFGLNGSTITASHNGITSQTNQSLGMYATGGTTDNTSAAFDARSLTFNGLGGASVGFSGGSVEFSVPVVSTVTATGAMSISTNGATVSMGVPAFSAGIGTLGNTLGNTGTVTNQILFAGGNNITLSQNTNSNGATVTINGTQSVQTQGVQTINIGGNTAGATASISSGALSLYGGSNITLSQNANSITISGGAGGGGGGGVALYDGANSISSGTASLAASGALTASINGQTLNLSAPQMSSLSATGALSLFSSSNTISIGAPQTSSIVGTNGINISTSGGTISIDGSAISGGGGGGTVSNWEPMPVQYGSLTSASMGNATLYLFKLQPEAYISASQLMRLVTVTYGTSSNSSHAGTVSLSAGIYSANGASLSLMASGSTAYQWTNTSNNSTASHFGLKGLTMPLSVSMTPGNYWIGLWSKTSSAGSSYIMSNMLFTNMSYIYSGQFGDGTHATAGMQENVGYYSVSVTSAMPSSIAPNAIIQSNLRINAIPYIAFKNTVW